MPTAINTMGRRVNLPTLPQGLIRPDGSSIWPTAKVEAALRQMHATNVAGVSFFTPDKAMVQWLATYAKGRIIFDIGCGDGYLLRQLRLDAQYTRAAGIEPRWNPLAEHTLNNWPLEWHLQVICGTVQGLGSGFLTEAAPDNVLLVCCRPAHSGYCADALRLKAPGVEFLYITKPGNWDKYDDLEEFRDQAVLLDHEGQGNENEKVWSIT